MPRHSEPIRKVVLADGTIRWRVHISTTTAGKRVRSHYTFDSHAEAEQCYANATLGNAIPKARDTFDEWADRWIADKEDSGLRPVTLAGYRSDLTHPRAAFGKQRVQDITEDHIKALARGMRDQGASKRTTGKVLTTLRSVFHLAMRKQLIRTNPAEDVAALGRDPKERDALTIAELRALRTAITGTPMEAIWLLVLAGLRRSEVCGLRWTDLDLTAGTVSIERGRGIIGGEQAPKTRRGRRTIPLDPERVELLKVLRSTHAETFGLVQARDGYVLLNDIGKPMRPEMLSDRWRELCEATEGVRGDHTLHAARHSTVTAMRNAGVPDHIVARFHGHDETVMRRTYSHAHVEELKAATAALSFGS